MQDQNSKSRICTHCSLAFTVRKASAMGKFCSKRCKDQHGPNVRPLLERFWKKVDKSGECWLWKGWRSRSGYGVFIADTHYHGEAAHRVSYRIAYGEIPNGLFVCHACDVRNCVRPDHLWLGTNADNMDDMNRKGRGKVLLGEASGMAKLTADRVREIRRRLANGETQVGLAREFGVSDVSISGVWLRKTWRHVD